MLHYTAYVCLSDIDVKQTYSRFHADSDAILGKDGIMSDIHQTLAIILKRLKRNKLLSLLSIFGDIHERNR